MNITQHTSGNLNEIRAYPFADTASRISRSGVKLDELIITDAHIWWPSIYGQYAFLSSITVSRSLVTATIATYDDNSLQITPVAIVHTTRPYTAYKPVQLTALIAGVGGWLSFGRIPDGWTDTRTFTFDNYEDSLLLPRLAQSYDVFPVTSVSKLNTDFKFTGNVSFLAGSALTITEETRLIDGADRRCIVFSLDPRQLPDLYQIYSGPCGNRPESNTCVNTAIKTINGVEPDANGLVYLQIIDTGTVVGNVKTVGGENKGIVLSTPVESRDLCLQPSDTIPEYEDPCNPVVIPPEPSGSSSSSSTQGEPYTPGSSSSSSLVPQNSIISYLFDDVEQLADWSLFDEAGSTHVIDWEATESDVFNTSTDPRWDLTDDNLVLPFARSTTTDNTRVLRNNRYVYSLNSANDYAELKLTWALPPAQLDLCEADSSITRTVYAELSDEYLKDEAAQRALRAKVAYSKAADGVWSVCVSLECFNGTAWTNVISPICRNYSPCSSSSSSVCYPDELPVEDTLTFKITRVDATTASDYSISIKFNNDPEITGTFDQTLYGGSSGEYNNLKFFGFRLTTDKSPDSVVQLAALDSVIRFASIEGKLNYSACDYADFTTLTGRTQYKLKYDPNAGWSNDFGTGRALDQFDKKQPLLFTSNLFDLSGSNITYNQQVLRADGDIDHKYAILRCDNSSVARYISVAFRRATGSPKVGIALGWQGTAREYFWAIMVDLFNRQIAYGMHYLGHKFQTGGWIPLSVSGTDWHLEWHRLLVRVNGPAPYSISAWVDPDSSVVSAGITKTIEVAHGSPTYTTTNKAEWNGSSISTLQFADGPPGIYAYDGEIEFAEFTVSPTAANIIVPNKVPWLTV